MNTERYEFRLPAKAENLGAIRLTTSAIAYKLNFTIDKLEDIKLVISEACNLSLRMGNVEEFVIIYYTHPDKITINIRELKFDNIEDDFQYQMAQTIIKALVDRGEFKKDEIILEIFN